MTTIVLSDCHGHPELVSAALDDAGFSAGRDRLVFAGDFLDRGPRPAECLELLEAAGAEMLLGNHDAAVVFGQAIWPQDAVSWTFADQLLDGVATGAWRLAASAHGVLITHAGVTRHMAHAVAPHAASCADGLAAALNEALSLAVSNETLADVLLDSDGPLWLRPQTMLQQGLPAVPQIVGHTSLWSVDADELARLGVHLIDPGAGTLRPGAEPMFFSYAVIGKGGVEVRTGRLPHARERLAS